MAHGRDAIHHRHLVVHGDHVRLQRNRLVNRLFAVGGRADHLDAWIGGKNFRDAAAEETRIVHHQDLDCHKHSVRWGGRYRLGPTKIKYAVRRNA